jgi:tRNA A-37 threonylcarbamoyl transferase component Bud32
VKARIDLSFGPIATGRTADVFAVGENQVLKLLKPGFDLQMLIAESTKTAAVHAAGGPAPDVSDLVDIDGRPGILIERIHGNSMLDAILANDDDIVNHVMAFADLHARVLGTPLDADLPDVKDFLASKIDNANLPLGQRTAAKDHMIGLPSGDATLHGDYHPGNIIVAPDGPTVIDWGEASRGDAAADIARTLLLLTPESVSGAVPNPGNIASFVAEFANGYKERCIQATAATIKTVAAWRLPMVAARLSEGIAEETALLRAEVARLTSDSRRT